MKKCQPLLRSQHEKETTNTPINHTPKPFKKPLSKFQAYENLIDEFIAANPNYSEYELDQACLYFATKCGLTVAEKAKAKMGGNHVY